LICFFLVSFSDANPREYNTTKNKTDIMVVQMKIRVTKDNFTLQSSFLIQISLFPETVGMHFWMGTTQVI
jgi:hypothetical protein